MFTQAGLRTIGKMIFILAVAVGGDLFTVHFFDAHIQNLVLIFFLMNYLLSFEQKKDEIEDLKNRIEEIVTRGLY